MTPEPQEGPEYALRLSQDERKRFRLMAARDREEEASRWAAAGVKSGAQVADIGCGPGAVLIELARIVGDGGEVIGVEPDPEARAAAEEEIAAAGVQTARVLAGTGTASTLSEGRFDTVMVRHVLFHVGAAAPAVVRHCASLLRPGGHLYLVDTHADAICLALTEPESDVADLAARYREFQHGRGCDVGIGPRLGPLLLSVGLELTERVAYYQVVPGELLRMGGPLVAAIPAMMAAGAATVDDEERWRAGLRRVASIPGAALFVPLFIAVGGRPA